MMFVFASIAHAQEEGIDKNYLDTAILGTWKIEDQAMVKMVSTSRDNFLRPVIIFKDRQVFEVEKERHEWNWNFSAENQEIEIADMEEMLVQSYKVVSIDGNKLVLLMGKQEIIFTKVR